MERGTSLRHIQAALGYNSSKTTEIYTHVATNTFKTIKNLLDWCFNNGYNTTCCFILTLAFIRTKPIKNNLNAYICNNITNKAYKNGFRNPIKQFLLN